MQIHVNFPLSEILHYKIGGNGAYVLEISSRKDLLEALAYVRAHNIQKVLPVGIGSNLLVSDSGYEGAVLWFNVKGAGGIEKKENGKIEVFAACLLDDVIQFSFSNQLIGLEWAGGLPSTMGGAVRGNVGAFGSEIKNIVDSADVVDILDPTYALQRKNKEELGFSYRNSVIKQQKNLIVASCLLQFKEATSEEIERAREVYLANIEYRKTHHDLDYPSCGSVFKNIVEKEKVERVLQKWPDITEQVESMWHGKVAMGYVNKRLGFSGFTVGGAQVSEKHGNYIINKKNASFVDVMTIIGAIQHRVQQEFGFTPEPEVEIVD